MRLLLHASPAGVGRGCSGGTESTAGGTLWRVAAARKTELAAMATGSLGEAGGTGAGFAARATTNHGHFIGDGADDVQYEVVDDQEDPRPDHDKAKEELQGGQKAVVMLDQAKPYKHPLEPCLDRRVLVREQGEQPHGRHSRREGRDTLKVCWGKRRYSRYSVHWPSPVGSSATQQIHAVARSAIASHGIPAASGGGALWLMPAVARAAAEQWSSGAAAERRPGACG